MTGGSYILLFVFNMLCEEVTTRVFSRTQCGATPLAEHGIVYFQEINLFLPYFLPNLKLFSDPSQTDLQNVLKDFLNLFLMTDL